MFIRAEKKPINQQIYNLHPSYFEKKLSKYHIYTFPTDSLLKYSRSK